MKVTLREVAQRAGVSPITASRALHNPSLVRPGTLAKVKEAAEALSYRPNPVAQGLRTGRMQVIMLAIRQKQTYDPLIFEFALGISQTLHHRGYSLLLHLSLQGDVRLDEVVGRADGLILTDIEEDDARISQLFGYIPLAIFGTSALVVPQVDIDDVEAARLATEHLLQLGYRRIAMVAGDRRLLYMKNRIQGYVDTMRRARADPAIAYGSLDIHGGEMAMRSFVELPEAVFCASDGMAVGVLKFLSAQNVQLPVVGCDGLQIGEITTPTLTSIKLPFYQAGQKLAEAILKVIDGEDTGSPQLIRPDIIVRNSTWRNQRRT